MTHYTEFIADKMALLSKEKTIVDIGGGERFQKWLAPYQPLFANCDYKTMDYDARTGADIVGDIHKMPLADNSVDAFICSSVLEHVENPIVAVQEMKRVVRPGGTVFVFVPSIYPYHARKGSYPDYWRFFDDTLELLFKGFSSVEIQKRAGFFRTLSLFIPFQNKLKFILMPLTGMLDTLFRTHTRTTTDGYFVYAVK